MEDFLLGKVKLQKFDDLVKDWYTTASGNLLHPRPRLEVGECVTVGSLTGRDTWQTTPITEILVEKSRGRAAVEFKTKNSLYRIVPILVPVDEG
jgi:hypothetical protein